jgi:N-acetylneuraminate lyase
MTNKIGGLWPAMFTPVDHQGNPAMDQLEKLVQLFLKQELDGLYILGSTGQGFLLTEKQRMEVARRVLEIVQGKIPVIVQVGALNTHESIRLAKTAQQDGAYGVSSVGPIYYDVNPDKTFAHYEAIGSAIDIPFFPYHIGNQSIFHGKAHNYVKRILGLPNIEGMKLTTQNLYEVSLIHNFSEGKLILFSGADELLCQASLCGTVGAIGSFFNLWGEECKYVREAFIKGNFQLGRNFMLTFQDIIYHTVPNIWPFFRKAMLMKYSIDIGCINPPLGLKGEDWSEQEIVRIFNCIEAEMKIENK